MLRLKFFVSDFYKAENTCIFPVMSYSPCDSQMSPHPLRYILCTLSVMNILSLPTLSLICPWTIPLRTFVSTIIVIIESILTLDSKSHECTLSCLGRAMGNYRGHWDGAIIPCTECHKLVPQIHQMRQNVLLKKTNKQKMPLSNAFPSNLILHTVILVFNMLVDCKHSDFFLFGKAKFVSQRPWF